MLALTSDAHLVVNLPTSGDAVRLVHSLSPFHSSHATGKVDTNAHVPFCAFANVIADRPLVAEPFSEIVRRSEESKVKDYILPGLLGLGFMVVSIMFAQVEGDVVESQLAPVNFQPLEVILDEPMLIDTIAPISTDEDGLIQASFMSGEQMDEQYAPRVGEAPRAWAK